ncbi:MAG: TrkA family potassium uptake protein [Dehalococcoidales bacterium]|nr:TrkA family potassium uptake protein [Dehalococcoidales bacterium]
MSKQVAVIGLGRFGMSLATILYDSGYEVLAIDKSSNLVEEVGDHVTHAVRADATEEGALRRLGIDRYDVAVVTVGASIQNSVMIAILLKKMGVRYIVARADNELHGEILRSIGAHKVIFPEKDTAIRTGPVLTIEGVSDYIPLVNGSGVVKARAAPFFIGKTLGDIGFSTGSKGGVVVLMIQRGKEGLIYPSLEEVVSHVDVLVMAGNNSDIEKMMEQAEKEA